MQLKLLFFLAVIFCCSTVFAQKVISETKEFKWQVKPVSGNFYHTTFYSRYGKGIIKLDNNNAIVTVEYPKEEYGIAMIDQNGQTHWENRIKGNIIFVCKIEDKIIVLYSEEPPYKNINSIHAVSVDSKNGTTIADSKVFTNSSGRYIELGAFHNINEHVCHLLIRATNFKRQVTTGPIENRRKSETNELTLITINKELQVANTHTLNSKAIEAFFLGADLLPDGNLLIASKAKDQMMVEKFNIAIGKCVDEVTTTVKMLETKFIHTHIVIDNNHVYLGIRYSVDDNDPRFSVYKIDFPGKAIKMQETALNPAFTKLLETQNGSVPRVLKKRGIREIYPVATIATENRIAYINEYHASRLTNPNGSTFIYTYNDVVISVFDKQLKNTGNIIIPKGYSSFINSGTSVGVTIKDNKLILFFNTNTGGVSLGATFVKVDLESLKYEQQALAKTNMPSDAHIEGDAIIWFGNSAMVPYYIPRGIGTKAWTTGYQIVSY